MKERRSLVEGITPVERSVEEQFVFAGKSPPPEASVSPVPAAAANTVQAEAITTVGRMPLSTRIRADYALALKRASLERQLSRTTPHTLQDILEEALEPWLRANGYLSPPRP